MNVMDNGVDRYFMSREDAERVKSKSESIVLRDAAAQIISLMDAITAAVQAEREACAKIADEWAKRDEADNGMASTGAAYFVANAIRARGEVTK